MAHLHSGYTYPHVLYVIQYSVFNSATIPAYKHHTSEEHVPRFFYLLPLPYHTFFEPFLLNDRKSVVVRLIAVHDKNTSACHFPLPFNPSNILNGKYAKFLPIYKNFSEIILLKLTIAPL